MRAEEKLRTGGVIVRASLSNLSVILCDTNFAILGSGSAARGILNFLSPIAPDYLVDTSVDQQGLRKYGYVIHSPNSLKRTNIYVVILTTLNYHIAKRCLEDQLNRNLICLIPPIELIYGYR